MASEAVTSEEIGSILRDTEAAAIAFIRGDAEPYLAMSSTGDDYTIMGPFGGPTTIGYSAYSRVAPMAARAFADGVSHLHLVEAYSSGDLLVLVLEERQRASIGGSPEQDWSLRVTQVYRREPAGWRVVHRHADPLARRLSVAEAAGFQDRPR